MRTVNKSHHNATHGLSRSTEYKIWRGMKARCYNSKNAAYKHYGGRGIVMCEEWINSFEDFMADMGERPSEKHSIDRINNDLGYYKDNCRWATVVEQNRNKRGVILIKYKGEEISQDELAKVCNVAPASIAHWASKGKTAEEIVEYFATRNKANDYLMSRILKRGFSKEQANFLYEYIIANKVPRRIEKSLLDGYELALSNIKSKLPDEISINALAEKEYPPIHGDEPHLDGNERNRQVFELGFNSLKNLNEDDIERLARIYGCGGLEHIFFKGFKAALNYK